MRICMVCGRKYADFTQNRPKVFISGAIEKTYTSISGWLRLGTQSIVLSAYYTIMNIIDMSDLPQFEKGHERYRLRVSIGHAF